MSRTFIIAEAGVNHNGNINLAKKLIDIAAEAHCDAVKFQTFMAEEVVTKTAKKSQYQNNNIGYRKSQYEMLKELELGYKEHIQLKEYCDQCRIMFLSTPFEKKSVDLLNDLDIPMFKVSSGDITNKPLLEYVAKKQKPIILSTGMATLEEIEEALNWIYLEQNIRVTLLHCTTNYPTDMNEVNLKAMQTMKEVFKIDIGYSDHTMGIEVPIAAVALGATVIEKHFTISRDMIGPDHRASLEPHELKKMVSSIRNIEKALGSSIKQPTGNERIAQKIARKSIVAIQRINKGQKIELEMIAVKRPGYGIQPKYLTQVIGKRVNRDINEDEVIRNEDIY